MTTKIKTRFDAKDGDIFIVRNKDTGEMIRGIEWADTKTGEYCQVYVHNMNILVKGRKKTAIQAVKYCEANIEVTDYSDGGKRFHYLADLVNKHKWTTGAEIGVAKGTTTFHLIKNCPKLFLTAVDFWPTSQFEHLGRKWRRRYAGYKKNSGDDCKLNLLKGQSVEMAKKVKDKSLDFVFIDAMHDEENCYNDIKAWVPKVKDSGMILGHDYNWAGVEKACAKAFGKDKVEVWWIDNVWWIWKKDAKIKRAAKKPAVKKIEVTEDEARYGE